MGAKDARTTTSDGDVLLIRCPSKSQIPPNSFIFIEIRASGGVHPPSFRVRWTPCERRTKRRIFLMGYADVNSRDLIGGSL